MEANNTKKLREEVDSLLAWAEGILRLSPDMLKEGTRECCEFVVMCCKDALAEPPRQCDVGTVEEQKKRFDEFCTLWEEDRLPESVLPGDVLGTFCSDGCPCKGDGRVACSLEWAQMPYTEKEDNKKTGDNHGIE